MASLAVHPEFNGRNLANDFAVLFMATDFSLDYNVDTVCLPEPGENFDNKSCFATGWGKNKFGAAGEFQVVLKELEIPVVDHDTCQEKFRATRLGPRFRLDPSFICAGGRPGQDTCEGDGGLPWSVPPSLPVRPPSPRRVLWPGEWAVAEKRPGPTLRSVRPCAGWTWSPPVTTGPPPPPRPQGFHRTSATAGPSAAPGWRELWPD